MKKGICILVMVVIAVALSACGGSQDQSADTPTKSKSKTNKVADMSVDVPDSWTVEKDTDDEYDAQMLFHGDVDEDGNYGDNYTACIIDEEVTVSEGQTVDELFDEYTAEIETQIRESDDAVNLKVKEDTYDGKRVKIMSYQTADGVEVREAFIIMDNRVISVTMDSTIPDDVNQFEAIVKSIRAK